MKNFFVLIVAAIIAVMLYLPCRDLAVRERKTSEGVGGEILVPIGTMLGACLYICDKNSSETSEGQEEFLSKKLSLDGNSFLLICDDRKEDY